MNNKYNVGIFSELIMGICFIIVGVIVFIGKNNLYIHVINLTVLVLLLLSVFYFLKTLIASYKGDVEAHKNIFNCLFNLIACLVLSFFPNISLSLLPVAFSLYLFLLGCSQMISYFLFLSNNVNNRRRTLIIGLIYFVVSIPILLSPLNRLSDFLLWVSIYSLFLGITFCGNFLEDFIFNNNRLRNRIRVSLPKILEAVIPYSVMVRLNKYSSILSNVDYDCGDFEEADLFVLVHASSGGVNMFGHADIYFEDYVYSYGNYDEGSRKYKEMFGDGVIFKTKKFKNYINFCIDNSKKTIFVFGIKLTDKEKNSVRDKLESIFANTCDWDYNQDKMIKYIDTYAKKLYYKTKARFYKFKNGKYKTYFVLGSNCCFLADDVLGKNGANILNLSGILTPGTFYDYLNRKLKCKNSVVVFKRIYNSSRKMK